MGRWLSSFLPVRENWVDVVMDDGGDLRGLRTFQDAGEFQSRAQRELSAATCNNRDQIRFHKQRRALRRLCRPWLGSALRD